MCVRNWLFSPLLLFLLISEARAQPEWVSAALRGASDLEHPDAAALILVNTAEVEISKGEKARTRRRYAVKILKRSGEAHALLAEFTAPYRKIKDLRGWLLEPDGHTRKLSRKDDTWTVSTTEASGYYDDSMQLRARFPDVSVGDVVAFAYTIEEEGWGYADHFFSFQRQQPVKFAQFSVAIPDGWRLHRAEWRTEDLLFAEEENRYVWTAEAMPYQPDEPLRPSWAYLSPSIGVTAYDPNSSTHFSDWAAASRWAAELFEEPTRPEQTVRSFVQQFAGTNLTVQERLQRIADFVRDDVRYVAVEIGKGRFKPRPAATTLRNRFGDCKDKVTLMRALLQAVGIPSLPVLVNSTHVVEKELPTPFQFNHCIVAVPSHVVGEDSAFVHASSDGWLFFDPTDESTRLGYLPRVLQGDWGLVVSKTGADLRRLPRSTRQRNRRRYRAHVKVGPGGSVVARVRVTDFGDLALQAAYEFRTRPLKEQVEQWQEHFATVLTEPTLATYETGPLVGDSTWVSFELHGRLTSAGSLYFLKPDVFLQPQDVRLSAEKRTHPIWFGRSKWVSTRSVWELPPTWKVDPETVTQGEGDCGVARFTYETQFKQGRLHYTSRVEYLGGLLPVTAYPQAQAFDKQFSAFTNVTVVASE